MFKEGGSIIISGGAVDVTTPQLRFIMLSLSACRGTLMPSRIAYYATSMKTALTRSVSPPPPSNETPAAQDVSGASTMLGLVLARFLAPVSGPFFGPVFPRPDSKPL